MRRLHCSIDIGTAGVRHFSQRFTSGRILDSQYTAAVRIGPFAIDPEFISHVFKTF